MNASAKQIMILGFWLSVSKNAQKVSQITMIFRLQYVVIIIIIIISGVRIRIMYRVYYYYIHKRRSVI